MKTLLELNILLDTEGHKDKLNPIIIMFMEICHGKLLRKKCMDSVLLWLVNAENEY